MPSLLPGSQFPGPPPWHWRCRTVLVPITKTWNELSGKKGISEPPASTRASMDGQVASRINYEKWLKAKPEAFQKKVLGPGKFKLWKKGKLPFSKLIDSTGKPLTLAELAGRTKGV